MLLGLTTVLEKVGHFEQLFKIFTDLLVQLQINLLSLNILAVFLLYALLVVLLIPPLPVDGATILMIFVKTEQTDGCHLDDILAAVDPD